MSAVEQALSAIERLSRAKYPIDPQMRLAYETGVLRGLVRALVNVNPAAVEKMLSSEIHFYNGQADVLEKT